MVNIYNDEEIKILREGGKHLSKILKELTKKVKSGISTKELDWLAENLIRKIGGRPSFKNYKPDFMARPYPATICASLNDVIVHGVPNSQPLNEGDVLSLDIGMEYKGLYTDMAITVGVGKISKIAKQAIETAKKALDEAIKKCQVGGTLGDVGFAIQNVIRSNGFLEMRVLTGHGIGKAAHEDPDVLNYGEPHRGMRFQAGMVIAIEPMLAIGSNEVAERADFSFVTKDGSLATHFEHTIAITEKGPIVITK